MGDRWTVLGGGVRSGPARDRRDRPRYGRERSTRSFAKGKIFWSPSHRRAAGVRRIGAAYDGLGAEFSRLGLPTRTEYAVPGGNAGGLPAGALSLELDHRRDHGHLPMNGGAAASRTRAGLRPAAGSGRRRAGLRDLRARDAGRRLVVGGAATDRAVVPWAARCRCSGTASATAAGCPSTAPTEPRRQGAAAPQILDFYYAGTTSVRRRQSEHQDRASPTAHRARGATRRRPGRARPGHRAGRVLPAGPTAWRIVRAGGGSRGALPAARTGPWEHPPRRASRSTPGRCSSPDPTSSGRPVLRRCRGFRGAAHRRRHGYGLATVNERLCRTTCAASCRARCPPRGRPRPCRRRRWRRATYALYKVQRKPAGQYWDICDTTACQVYGGARTWVNGKLTAPRRPPPTRRSRRPTGSCAQSGGRPSTPSSRRPTVAGPPTEGPPTPWPARIPGTASRQLRGALVGGVGHLGRSAFRLPAVGTLRSMEITARDGRGEWGGRVLKVMLRGVDSAGRATAVEVTGNQIRSAAGLRSNWFTFDVPESAIDARYASSRVCGRRWAPRCRGSSTATGSPGGSTSAAGCTGRRPRA